MGLKVHKHKELNGIKCVSIIHFYYDISFLTHFILIFTTALFIWLNLFLNQHLFNTFKGITATFSESSSCYIMC